VRNDRTWLPVLRYLAIIGTLGILLFPVYYLVASAFKSPETLFTPEIFPSKPSLRSFQEAFTAVPLSQWALNSLIVALATCLMSVTIATMAAYSLARFRYWGSSLFARLILFVYMFPSILLVIPYYVLMNRLGLGNSLTGLVLSYTTFSLPFGVWFLTSYLRTIPPELDEAALVDGCTRLGALYRVILPALAPGLAATSVYVFLVSWNEFLFAFVLISSGALRTLPLGVAAFFGVEFIPWGTILATSVLMCIPVVIFSFFAQKWLVMGLTAGSVKG
jgi:multiple sugar transport system permease protein